jgi:APA family basic amino acid/polyamine antiporter
MVFAFGRNGSIPAPLARVHPRFQTPSNAILIVGAATLVAVFLGDALLVPVTEVGSAAAAFGWLASCLSLLIVASRPASAGLPSATQSVAKGFQPARPAKLQIIATLGATAALALVLMKFLPIAPGHFTTAEYIALAIWLLLGAILRVRRPS